MSFLGGPECSTAANPLAQFQKQTSADTSLQRDRLTGRSQQQPFGGFRSQQGVPEDAAFHEFQNQGPMLGEQIPHEAAYLEQLRREELQHQSGGGGGGGNGWAGEFAQQGPPPAFAAEQFAQQQGRNGAFSPQDFAQFRQSQMSPLQQRSGEQSPIYGGPQQSAYQRPPMYGASFGMQRPMMFGGGAGGMYGQPSPMQQQQYEGKGKSRVQELSDTDWEKQFEELSTQDKVQDEEAVDREANEAMEAELNQMDRYVHPPSLLFLPWPWLGVVG